jgi:hypothetical protein
LLIKVLHVTFLPAIVLDVNNNNNAFYFCKRMSVSVKEHTVMIQIIGTLIKISKKY